MSVKSPAYWPLFVGQRYKRLSPGMPDTRGMKSGYVCLQPGEEIGMHSTEAREESLVILEGSADIMIEGSPDIQAAAPSVVYIPAHTAHNVRNCGQSLLQYVFIVAPCCDVS